MIDEPCIRPVAALDVSRRGPRATALRVLSALALSAAPAWAQVRSDSTLAAGAADTVHLTWAEARSRALQRNPELLAARLDTAIARGELRQAGLVLRFNPDADLLADGGGSGIEVGVSQELELFNQQGARRAAGQAGLQRSRAGVANASRLTLGEVERAFYRLVAAARRSSLAEEVLGLNRRLADVAGRQLQAGEVSRLDYNLATIELGRSRARALATQRERAQGNVELGRLLGLPSGTVITPAADSVMAPSLPGDSTAAISLARGVGEVPPPLVAGVTDLDADSLTAFALASRPDLAERAAAIRQAEAQATVARREAWPNLVLRATSQREAGEARAFRPGVGLALPIFNRNRGEVQARQAQAQQAELERAAVATKVRADVASAVAAYRAAATEVQVLAATVLGPARQNRQLLETAYREGKIGLPELLLIRNQAVEAELEYWDSWLAMREASAALSEAIGQHLTTPQSGAP